MTQPHDFNNLDKNLIYKLNKVIYDFKQASRVWYEKLIQSLLQFDFTHPRCDHSLFVYYQ